MESRPIAGGLPPLLCLKEGAGTGHGNNSEAGLGERGASFFTLCFGDEWSVCS